MKSSPKPLLYLSLQLKKKEVFLWYYFYRFNFLLFVIISSNLLLKEVTRKNDVLRKTREKNDQCFIKFEDALTTLQILWQRLDPNGKPLEWEWGNSRFGSVISKKREKEKTKQQRNKGKRKEKKKKNNYPSEKLRMLQSFETWLSGQEFWGSPKRTKRKNEKKKKGISKQEMEYALIEFQFLT